MRLSALALGLLAAAGTTTDAQDPALPVAGHVQHVSFSYDLTTGLLTRTLPQAPSQLARGVFPSQVAEVACFENVDVGMPVAYAVPAPGEEWVDWGVKDCDASQIVSKVEIAYGTTAFDVSVGGQGAALEVALYAGTQGDADVLGTELLRIPLTGLPGRTGPLAAAYSLTIDLAGPMISSPNVPDGKLGWGYTSLDGETGPLLVRVQPSAFGPDVFGYEADLVPDGFVDIAPTGTLATLPSDLDDSGELVPIGFDFEFYGATITEIAACSNGYLTTDSDLSDFSPDCIPGTDTSDPDHLIAPYWADLSPNANGDVYYETRGVAPCREFVVQWDECSTFASSTASVTMQAVLHESTNAIEFHYGTLLDAADGTSFFADGADGVTGIEGDAIALGEGLSIGCGTNAGGADANYLAEGQSFRITLGRENANGTVDRIQRYAYPAASGSLLGSTFFTNPFGDTIHRASFYLLVIEEDGSCANADQIEYHVPANAPVFSSATLPVLGTLWLGDVDVSGFSSPTMTMMAVAASIGSCSGPGNCPTDYGDLLLDTSSILFFDSATPLAGLSQHQIPLPKILDKCGAFFTTQAAVFDPSIYPGVVLTNAIDVQLGF